MEGFLKQSTAVNITVLMIDSSDHITGKTGLTLTIYATKAAGSPASISPTVTELDSTNVKGLYKLALTTSHTDTLGELQLHITASGADPADYKWQVSTYLPGEAATLQADQAVNVTKVNGTSQTARDLGASVLLSSGTGTGQISLSSGTVTVGTNNDKTGYSLSSAGVQAIWDALTSALTTVGSIGKLFVDNINATISSRLDSASYTAPLDAAGTRSAVGLASANLDTQLSTIDDFLDTEIAAIKAKTDNLPADPADASDIAASFATVNSKLDAIDDYVDSEVAAIKAKTDQLTFTVANELDVNVQAINDTALTGDGSATPWGPA
jgi:hypothetical protein